MVSTIQSPSYPSYPVYKYEIQQEPHRLSAMFIVSVSIFALLSFSLPRPVTSSVAYCSNQDYESGALGISPYQTYNAALYSPVQINYALPPDDCPSNNQVSGYFFFSPLGKWEDCP